MGKAISEKAKPEIKTLLALAQVGAIFANLIIVPEKNRTLLKLTGIATFDKFEVFVFNRYNSIAKSVKKIMKNIMCQKLFKRISSYAFGFEYRLNNSNKNKIHI